ncbi:type I secretion system permease/ATPase [Anaerocolumna xylanovorans]|uniref:ATP-binding cassette, subfamily B, HlyB/CyaB n=1 Tax=Anaerocolumna xylanovorans DSM 12503 TaxID=1121345 RepID=A0A1M7YMD4_9FIRM|nr:type I secretion system permease/ATPase [Anaerocolumna xylanovorans]SHO53755.1 ATP-binding cassette, subfamily B, HlyB/CyaB [Anaerocolumna xylanovorans DSM 12503]
MDKIVNTRVEAESGTEDANREQSRSAVDTGLNCFIMLAKFHGISADPDQIKHAFAIGEKGMSRIDLLRAAKELGLKAKDAPVKFERLSKLPLPAIAEFKSGEFIILAGIEEQKILVLDPVEGRTKIITKEEFIEKWNGSVILLTPRGYKSSDHKFGIKWFLPVIWKYRKPLAEVLIASLVLQLFGLVTPVFMQVIIDKVLVHKGITTLNVLTIGIIVVTVFEAIINISRTYVFTHTTSRIDVTLGARLFKHLFMLPLRYFEVRRVGDTIARVRELENIRQFLTGAPLTSVLDVMFIIVYIAVMFFYSTSLTFIVLATLPFFVALSLIVTPLLKHRLDEKFNCGAEQQSYLVEAVTGVQTVKSFALEPEAQKKWEGLISNYIKSSFKTSTLSGVAGAIGQFIQKVSDLLILWLGARLVMTGDISVGQLVAFRMLSGRVSNPILRLVQLWQDFQQTGLSIERLGDIFNTTPEPSMDPAKAKLPAINGHIRFEKVRFRYRIDGPEVIRDMSFDIRPGMIIGIVGRSGSGKSTISKLMQRLYIPEAGKILIDGVDISLADPSWLRRQIGVVLQENFLFNGTVRENISIHYPSISMNEIVRVAKIAGAHDFILELPEGYDTMVGEKGSALSGGQRQRIAIARALLTNPRILIFDEATSALDYESESIIQRNLKLMCQGRTVIIIAHRLSTLRDAHKIMAIDRGNLIEYGSHEELLARKGLYSHLYSQQERGI